MDDVKGKKKKLGKRGTRNKAYCKTEIIKKKLCIIIKEGKIAVKWMIEKGEVEPQKGKKEKRNEEK